MAEGRKEKYKYLTGYKYQIAYCLQSIFRTIRRRQRPAPWWRREQCILQYYTPLLHRYTASCCRCMSSSFYRMKPIRLKIRLQMLTFSYHFILFGFGRYFYPIYKLQVLVCVLFAAYTSKALQSAAATCCVASGIMYATVPVVVVLPIVIDSVQVHV